MANPNSTLKALMQSLNLASEEVAGEYIDNLDPEAAKRLLEVLMSGQGGQTKNLEGGQGGFLAGLKNMVESRKTLADSDLPQDPRELSSGDKARAIEAFQRDKQKSDEAFVQGLKLLIEARNAEGLERFSRWPGELSDEDFPRKTAMFRAELEKQGSELIDKLKKQFDDQRIDMEALLKKHRTEFTKD